VLWRTTKSKKAGAGCLGSGALSRPCLLGSLLTWMAERKTRGGISGGHVERCQSVASRNCRAKGALDEMFFLDLPQRCRQGKIFPYSF